MSDEEQQQQNKKPSSSSKLIYPKGEASVKYAYKMASICGVFVFLIVLVVAATTLGVTNQKFGESWIATTANITDIVPCSHSNKDLYTPQVTFETTETEIITSTPKSTCYTKKDYVIGDQLDIVYDPENPEELQTQHFVDAVQITSIVFLSIGCVCCCFSSITYFYFLSTKRPGVPTNNIEGLHS